MIVMQMLMQLGGKFPASHTTLLAAAGCCWPSRCCADPAAAAAAAGALQGGGEGAECGAGEWPYLHCVFVPAWQLAVYSYRKATDDHIKLLDLSTGRPLPLEQGEYELRVGVPTGPDDVDNFVTGLALDYCIKVWLMRGGGGCCVC
jgi:hypothetical protein